MAATERLAGLLLFVVRVSEAHDRGDAEGAEPQQADDRTREDERAGDADFVGQESRGQEPEGRGEQAETVVERHDAPQDARIDPALEAGSRPDRRNERPTTRYIRLISTMRLTRYLRMPMMAPPSSAPPPQTISTRLISAASPPKWRSVISGKSTPTGMMKNHTAMASVKSQPMPGVACMAAKP